MILYAGAEWVGPAFPDNYLVGRQGGAVTGIVDHHSASTLAGLIARFTTSSGVSGGGASAHFAIDRDGKRYQVVDTADTAFHAGDFAANLATIGIEHIRQWGSGPGTPGYEPITQAQYRSSHELHVILAADNRFPLDVAHVRPHHDYIATTCPGDLDIPRILSGVDPMVSRALVRLAYMAGWGREPTPAELEFEAAAITDDASAEAVVSQILDAPDGQTYHNAIGALIAAGPAAKGPKGDPGPTGPPGPGADPGAIASHLKIVAQ